MKGEKETLTDDTKCNSYPRGGSVRSGVMAKHPHVTLTVGVKY